MIRILLTAGVVIAAMSFDVYLVRAAEGPWCAFISLGPSNVYEDCQYRSFEECRPNVISGNRGFCNHNPRWVDGTGVASPHPRGKRHPQRY